jgi:ABC-type transporter Mla MlaB component
MNSASWAGLSAMSPRCGTLRIDLADLGRVLVGGLAALDAIYDDILV